MNFKNIKELDDLLKESSYEATKQDINSLLDNARNLLEEFKNSTQVYLAHSYRSSIPEELRANLHKFFIDDYDQIETAITLASISNANYRND